MWTGKRQTGRMQNDGGFDRCRSVPFNAPAGAVSENAANAEVPALTRQNASCATSLLCYGGWLRWQTTETSPLCCTFSICSWSPILFWKYPSSDEDGIFPPFFNEIFGLSALNRLPSRAFLLLNRITCAPSVSPPVSVFVAQGLHERILPG